MATTGAWATVVAVGVGGNGVGVKVAVGSGVAGVVIVGEGICVAEAKGVAGVIAGVGEGVAEAWQPKKSTVVTTFASNLLHFEALAGIAN